MLNFRVLFLALASISLAVILFGCESETKSKSETLPKIIESASTIRYAKRFAACKINGCKTLFLFGNRNSKDTTAIFVLYPKAQSKPDFIKNAFY